MRPLRIGLSANIYQPDLGRLAYKGRRLLFMDEGMFHWVQRRGALPFLVPTSAAGGVSAADLIDSLDGIIMTGGVDMAPESYGEAPMRPEWSGDRHRDEYEIALVKAALAKDKPVLGICRGHQVVNVAMGGSLFQDIRTQNPGAIHHRIYDVYEHNHHPVAFESGSHLGRLYGRHDGVINSVHHQAVKQVGGGLVVEARSPEDGIVESVRLKDQSGPYLVGVQWHPEFQDPGDRKLLPTDPLLDEFLAAAKRRQH